MGLNTVKSSRSVQRPRYCRRCGAALALAPGAMGGVRCSNCGAAPGVDVMTAADLRRTHGPAEGELRYAPFSMQLRVVHAPRPRRRATAMTSIRASLQALVSRGQQWVETLPPPTERFWITATASAMAVLGAIGVVIALG